MLPLNIVKGISSSLSKKIIEIRENGFLDIYDFFVKMVSENIGSEIIKNLIMTVTLDNLYHGRHTLIDNMENLINYGKLVKKLGASFVLKPDLSVIDEYNREILINSEKELFGFYLSNHPVNIYKNSVKNSVNLCDISKYFNKYITCIGMIDRIKEVTTKNGDVMAFISISDEDSKCSVTAFPLMYHDIKIKKGDIIIIEGKVERRKDFEIIAKKIINVKEKI